MDGATDNQRQAIWDQWGNGVNADLLRIDNWFTAWGYMIPDQQAETLKAMLVDLSEKIGRCPGRPGNETFAPVPGPPVHAIGDDMVYEVPPEGLSALFARIEAAKTPEERALHIRGFDFALAERARMRRKSTTDNWFIALVALIGCIAVGWWLADYIWR